MIRLRTVIVSVTSAGPHREVCETGVEIASLFRVPVHGLVAPHRETVALAGFPGSFLPSAARRSAHGGRTLQNAAAGGDLRIKTELEQIGRRYHVETLVSVQTEAAPADNDREGAIAVVPLDLSHSRLGPQVRAAVAGIPPSGGVLLVPERHPSRTGGALCLTDGAEPTVAGTAEQIARRMGIAIRFVDIASTGGPDADIPGGVLNAGGIDAVRLVVCSARHLDCLGLDDPQSPVRRWRSSLLVLDNGTPG